MSSDIDQQARHERFERAKALVNLGRYTQALDELAPLLAGPADADAMGLAAQTLLALDRHDEAVSLAERSIAADPQQEWGHRLRSRALLGAALARKGPERNELLGKAVESAREAARLGPSQVVTLRSASEVERVAGNYAEAEGAIRWAIHLDPSSPTTWVANGLLAMDLGDLARAEHANRHAIELDPNQATAWNNLGVVLQRQGRWREASAAYAQSVRLNPPDQLVQGNVARLGLGILATVALLVPLPVLLLPFGAVVYLAVFAMGLFLFRPGGPWRKRAETLGIRTALRVRRLPLEGRFAQVASLRVVNRVTFVLVIVAISATSQTSPNGVAAVCAFILIALVLWQTFGARSRKSDPS